jgi:hypothetical protein
MWPFTSPYPEQRLIDVDGKTFDYIIVGGVSAHKDPIDEFTASAYTI